LFEVDGNDVRSLPMADGALCELDGRLFSVTAANESSAASTDPPIAAPSDAGGRVTASALIDGRWQVVPDGDRSSRSDTPETISCVFDRFEATDLRTGQLQAVWSGEGAWRDVQSSPRPPSIAADIRQSRFVQRTDGVVAIRDMTGTYQVTELSLPDLTRADQPPPMLLVDESESVVAGCVTSLEADSADSQRDDRRSYATSVCEVARR
jgi:hypothetical protein